MRFLLLLLFACAFLLSCKKKNLGVNETGSSADVYVAGYVYDDTTNRALYWKNGTPVMLPPETTGFNNSFAYRVSISGNDVYVLGQNPTGCLVWKNGIQQRPLDKAYDITDMAVVGSDVYVTGIEFNPNDISAGIATLWKNGQPTILSPDAKSSHALAIKISGKDIYIAGSVQYPGTSEYAAYWKNGALVPLEAMNVFSSASSIAIAGNARKAISG
jgi:hypothetical protein